MDSFATPLPSGSVTFLFTDIEGSTRLWEQHPEAMRLVLARHDAILRRAIETHGGHVFKTIGDAFCAAFAAAPDAVTTALAAQRALHAEEWGEVQPLYVRMALHSGIAELRGGDYYGSPLNRVARLLAAGHGGQMLLSQATSDLLRGALPEGASLRDLGVHRLKDLQQSEQIFQLLHPKLPADFPSLRSLEAFAHNLPRQLTSFVGREREMAEIKQLLAKTALLTLTGAGGCGKTRLGLQVAADLVEAFPDGVWLVELAALADPSLVPQAVATALGVREEPGRPLLQTLLDYLRARSLLLILDNCEHLLSACAGLAGALLRGCLNLRVLASSREGLGIVGEQTYRVPSLPSPDPRQLPPPESLGRFEAVQLFVDRAILSQPSFRVTEGNAAAVAGVCHRLDGIPLAIELAAARVRALPVEAIAQRLDDRFRLLVGGSRTALPRQQTLRALIDWSYDLLYEAERILLRRLSVFAGGWTLEAAEGVCAGDGIEGWEVLDLLTALVEKSLVPYEEQEGEARYRLLETVRQYARDRLLEAGEAESVRGRHRDWCLALAERAEPELRGPGQVAWLDHLEREHDNLRAALEWCQEEEGGAETGLRLAGALWWFWVKRGYFEEGRQRLQKALANAGAAPPSARVKALHGACGLAYFQGDYALGHAFAEESLALARATGDPWGSAFSLFHLAMLADEAGDHEQTTACAEECLTLARAIGDRWLMTHPLLPLAFAARAQGDLERAESLLEEMLALVRQTGDRWLLGIALFNLASVTQGRGNHERAQALYREQLVLHQEMEDRRGISWCLVGMAGVAQAWGQPERAARLLGAVENLLEAIGGTIPQSDRPLHGRTVAGARAALGDEAFAAAWSEGRALTLEQAVAFALEEPDADPFRQ